MIIKSTGDCNSTAASAIVDVQPASPSTPVTSVTQPTCTVATGTITVTVQNVGETYSFDNGASFQSSNSKSGLVSGTYQVIIKSTGNCNSSAASATLNSVSNCAPVVVNDVNAMAEDNPVSGNVSINDIQSGGGDNIWSLIGTNGGAAHGTVTMNTDGTYTYTPDPNFNGTDLFTYHLCNLNGDCSQTTVTITVTPVNDLPVAINNAITTREDTPISSSVANNDTPSGDGGNIWSLTGINGGAVHGTVTMTADGSYTYTPTTGFFGSDAFTYHLCDVNNDCSTATVNATINNDTDGMLAVDDVISTNEDSAVTGNVSTNDTPGSEGGNTWTLVGVNGGAAHGTVVLAANGSYTYTPVANYNGTDIITYQLCDLDGDCSVGTVTVTITSVNDLPVAVNDAAGGSEDVVLSGSVAGNDTQSGDGGNQWSVVGINGGAAHGTVVMSSIGNYTYTPNAGYFGTDSFTYKLCDSNSDCSSATVTITINNDNDGLLAVNDIISTNEDSAVTGNASTNDTPSSEGGNTWTLVGANGGAAHGTVLLAANGSYTYTPASNYNGTDIFTYQLCDPDGDCSVGTVKITITSVNDLPVAVNDAASGHEDTELLGSVAGNDVPSGDGGNTWTLTGTNGGASNGNVTMNTDGGYTYIPNTNYFGSDTFTYKLCDANGDCSTATVTVTIAAFNDPPVVSDITKSGTEDNIVTFAASDFSSAFSDVDGNSLTKVKIVSLPANGILKLSGVAIAAGDEISFANLGNITFSPSANWNGSTNFAWNGNDGTVYAASNTNVNISIAAVNDPPVVSDITKSGTEDNTVTLATSDFTSAFSDVDGNSLTKVKIVSLPANGILKLSGVAIAAGDEINAANLGNITFVPSANWNGSTNFTWNGNDGTVYAASNARLNISIAAVNDPPVALADVAIINEDGTLTGANLLSNDSDPEGNTLTIDTTPVSSPAHGTLTINANGTYTYTPVANYNGSDSFTYRVCDNATPSMCSTATVSITVTAVNDPPVALVDNFEAKENQKLEGNVLGNDYDIDGNNITLSIAPIESPAHGTLILSQNGDFIYQPVIDFIGNDSFIYQICDNGNPILCSNATVTIVVSKDENCDVFVPNSFSPNGDGIHDSFKIRCLYNYENPTIEIYNRWGNLVFIKDHYGDTGFWGSEADAWWNGHSDHKWTISTEELPVGTYYYILKLDKNKSLTGFLFLNK